MARQPDIINKSKASSHPLKNGRFYTGTVTAVLSSGKINIKIPELGTQYGPLMPLNTTSTSKYIVGDSVKCAFADEFFNEIIVFGSTRVKEDVFAVSDRGIDRFADVAERTALIPSPEEGRVVYILDSDELQIYNGTEWITVIDTGNSENITAATLVATSASIGTLTVTGASTLNVLGSANLTASTSIGNVSSAELAYLNGVTSAIQSQIDSKITAGDSGTVTNAMLSGSIADTKLSTISTAGKVSNSATTATSANTASAIVARDASGNFTAGTITATLSGAAPASQLSGQTGMWTSAARPGPYRLYRNDHDSAYNIQATWDGSSLWYLRGYLNDSYHAPCRVGYADSAGNSSTVGGLSVHSGRNNGANQIVRTQENGYILCGYINSDSGYNENNNSSPDRVWGSNAGGDSYLRAYRTSALSVASAATAGTCLGQSDSVRGYIPESSGFNGGLALRYSGDARLDSNYFVGYGTVGVATGSSNNLRRRSSDGYFLIEGSRRMYKRDIEYIDWSSSRDLLLSLKPAKFNWKDEFDGPEHWNPLMQQLRTENKEYGFIVEDVADVSTELVTYLDDNDDKTPTPMMWQQNGVISLLVKVVQELISKVEALENA